MVAQIESTSHARTPDLRERRRQETRREITQAALELFELQGSAATTVEEIARRAGVSPSTYFRCFATKEESVCGTDPEFEAALLDWLGSTAPEEVDLAGIESVYEQFLRRLMASTDDTWDQLLRTRRLIASDENLRAAAFAADALAMCRLTHNVAERVGGVRSSSYAKLLVEVAGVAIRIAFDSWVERVEAGDAADLVEIYRTTRQELRQISA
ncbi:TetR/AcrR family transcriptional regulator [Tomitella biformata]|uniref:TetR/AcrR family transcriptional regulator n=1 Tax=Tomitella biformata TaxID=630403 RepID=UPI000466278D|nr:TetR/AcrR family transcriptional regulator [Tomitella biformata]